MSNKIIKPYTDNKLVWDNERHQYNLALSYAKNFMLTLPYGSDQIAERELKNHARVLYNYIFNRINGRNRPIVEFCLNCTEKGRKLILEALESVLRADCSGGYNDNAIQNPIDFNSGNVIDRYNILGNIVNVECEIILENSETQLGLNILYRSVYPNQAMWQERLEEQYGE